jgi:hypothetical protein
VNETLEVAQPYCSHSLARATDSLHRIYFIATVAVRMRFDRGNEFSPQNHCV